MIDFSEKGPQELKAILLNNVQNILRNNVTTEALSSPATMEYADLVVNVHLWERLGAAYAALGQLKSYKE